MGVRSSLKYAISFVMFCLCTSLALNTFADECPSNWKTLYPEWIWCDDFESGTPAERNRFLNMALFTQNWHRQPASGEITFYAYFAEMTQAPDGMYWGNFFCQNDPRDALLTNQWYCLELEVQANTPGQHDGFQNMWIDGARKGQVSNMRWRDTTDLRINALQLTFSGTVPATEHLWIDNVVVSTQKIECLGSRQAPFAPTNLRVNRTGRGGTGIQQGLARTDHEIEPALARPEARKEFWKKKQA
jgi:hypothetical protein